MRMHLVAEATPLTSARLAAGAGYELTLVGAASEVNAAVEYFAKKGPNLEFGIEQGRFDGIPPWGGTATHTNVIEAPSAMLRFTSGNLDVNVRGAVARVGLPSSTPALWFDRPLNRQLER